ASAPPETVQTHPQEPIEAGSHVNAPGIARKMPKPPALRGSDQSRVPARSGNPPEIETGSARNSRNLCQAPLRILRIERCRIPQVRKQLVRARAGNKNDLGAVRRVDRIGIECL